MLTLNRWRVYAGWPYLAATIGLWLCLHAAGVNAALAGVVLAAFLPTRPTPAAGPLLAQAATALSALENAEAEARAAKGQRTPIEQEPVWEWASRNLLAASARLQSPADQVEGAVAPWSAYVILPLFAFSATGAALDVDLSSPASARVLLGVILGLVVGKPLGVTLAALAAVKARIAVTPDDATVRAFIGAAVLCGVSDPVALLMADHAFDHGHLATVAKIGVLAGSVIAAALGAVILATAPPAVTPAGPEAPAAA
jgi:Na+:H+ antiporter, NhaA family